MLRRLTRTPCSRPFFAHSGTAPAFPPAQSPLAGSSTPTQAEAQVSSHGPFSRLLGRACWQLAILVLVAGALGIAVNLPRSDRLPLVGDWSPKGRLTLPTGDDLAVPREEARQAWFLRTAVFVDARSQDQFLLGHIEGAREQTRITKVQKLRNTGIGQAFLALLVFSSLSRLRDNLFAERTSISGPAC